MYKYKCTWFEVVVTECFFVHSFELLCQLKVALEDVAVYGGEIFIGFL